MKEDVLHHFDRFQLITLSDGYRIMDFNCEIEEYSEFLKNYAVEYHESGVSKTHLLIDKHNANVVAYMSLVTDSIRLSNTEKEEHALEQLQFGSFPALKIGKLAVSKDYNSRYRGIGSLMLELARGFAHQINESGVACKFLTLDADVENDPNVINFYDKNGFKANQSYKKRTSTISMRLHIYGEEEIDTISKTGTES